MHALERPRTPKPEIIRLPNPVLVPDALVIIRLQRHDAALLRDKLRESGLYVEVGSPVCSAGSKYAQRFGIGGTRFSVSMQVSPSPAPSVTVVGSVPVDLSRVYVVVVEDNPQVLASICSVMRAAGYDVDQMVRTAACLAEVSRIFDLMPYWPPSLVVCDFRLGLEETANDVIRVLDERFAGTAPIPIIVYSAEIEPPVTATRPRVRVVVKSNDVTTLLRSMEEAVQDARREVPESAGDDGGSLARLGEVRVQGCLIGSAKLLVETNHIALHVVMVDTQHVSDFDGREPVQCMPQDVEFARGQSKVGMRNRWRKRGPQLSG